MSGESLLPLRSAIGELLQLHPADEMDLQRLTTGLSHNNFVCRTAAGRYFVKVYALGPNPRPRVEEINRVTGRMRDHGIPAPELVAYSPRFPNVVIHRYIDADSLGWDPQLLGPAATVYSRIAALALPAARQIGRDVFLRALQRVAHAIEQSPTAPALDSAALDSRAALLIRRVIDRLTAGLPDIPLLVLNLHDDFTENNLLADGTTIRLLCDWDSYRPVLFWENFASSSARLCSTAPRQGVLSGQRLNRFFTGLSPAVLNLAAGQSPLLTLFPTLAVLRQLRIYPFRRQVTANKRPDLREALLDQPLEHCEWLLDNAGQVVELVAESLHRAG